MGQFTLEANEVSRTSFEAFSAEMRVFHRPFHDGQASAWRLLTSKQGSMSVAQSSIDFRILAAESGWNEAALKSAFLKGLSEEMKDQLSTRGEPDSLESLISLSIRIDNRLQERRRVCKVVVSSLPQNKLHHTDSIPPATISGVPPASGEFE